MMRFLSWPTITRVSRYLEQFSGRIHHIQSLAFNQKCYSVHCLYCLRTSTYSIRPCHGVWCSLTRTTARDGFVLPLASKHNPCWFSQCSKPIALETDLGSNEIVDVKVKICGITNVADAEAAVQAGADALGLMLFAGSPRHITLDKAQDIARRLPPYVLRTGVFADPDPADVFAAIQLCQLNLLQFHGAETPEFCLQFGLMSMKAFRIQNADSLLPIHEYHTDAFLLDSHVAGKPGGTGTTFNWDLALEAKRFGKPIFLAGGLTAQNVAEAVRKVQPFGVDVSSGVEHSPGKKDAAKMQDFIAAVRGS